MSTCKVKDTQLFPSSKLATMQSAHIVVSQAGTQTPGQSAAMPPVQSGLFTSSIHVSPLSHCRPAIVAQSFLGVQTPGQSCAAPHPALGSCTHVSYEKHGGTPLVSQIRGSGTGGLVLTTQIPLQSRPVVVGSQVSRGSSAHTSAGSAHWMLAMPPQKTGSGQ